MIIDANVAIKWLVQEEDSEKAEGLLRGDAPLHAPVLLLYEAGNALLRHPRAGPEDVGKLLEMGIQFHSSDVRETFHLAQTHRLSFYDASFVELAQRLRDTLITADRPLYRKTRDHFQVRLLKDL